MPRAKGGINGRYGTHAKLLEALACLINVRDTDAQVTKATFDLLTIARADRVAVARIVDAWRIFLLSAVVPGEFDRAWNL